MNIAAVKQKRKDFVTQVQLLEDQDISDKIVDPFVLQLDDPLRRRIMRWVSTPLLSLQQSRNLRRCDFHIPFSYNLLAIEERFTNDASLSALLNQIRYKQIESVLIPGCYLGLEDVQFWLRRGTRRLEGIDVYSLKKKWSEIVPLLSTNFQSSVRFRQANIEKIPFEDETFDLIATNAVLEHVRNIRAMVHETARVLKPKGWAWHSFGPLYCTFGGDHCMPSFGFSHGYDHLLLEESEYQDSLHNKEHFTNQADPNQAFWAKNNQFSFLDAKGYLELFAEKFDQVHLVVKVSGPGLRFRQLHPDKWSTLLDNGFEESQLLIKSLVVVLQKK